MRKRFALLCILLAVLSVGVLYAQNGAVVAILEYFDKRCGDRSARFHRYPGRRHLLRARAHDRRYSPDQRISMPRFASRGTARSSSWPRTRSSRS
jgi:hypothetical protein